MRFCLPRNGKHWMPQDKKGPKWQGSTAISAKYVSYADTIVRKAKTHRTVDLSLSKTNEAVISYLLSPEGAEKWKKTTESWQNNCEPLIPEISREDLSKTYNCLIPKVTAPNVKKAKKYYFPTSMATQFPQFPHLKLLEGNSISPAKVPKKVIKDKKLVEKPKPIYKAVTIPDEIPEEIEPVPEADYESDFEDPIDVERALEEFTRKRIIQRKDSDILLYVR